MKILLCITGSIAAYKAAELVRLFIKAGDEVHVLMTKAATEFITPLTLQTLSRNPVGVDQFAPVVDWKPEHIAFADNADVAIVAPATANTIAKMRMGLADNLVSATLLATKAPILVAPAMNTGMWDAAATQENIEVLKSRGVTFIEPVDAELACGVTGKGCMVAPQTIFEKAHHLQ